MTNCRGWTGTVPLTFLLAPLAGCGGGAGTPTYSVGAQVSGLSGSGLTLKLSTSGTLSVTTNGLSTFPVQLPSQTAYQLTVKTQPSTPHSFGASGTDGHSPSGSLLLGSDGNFYGATYSGGSNANCKVTGGCGTLYRITPSGVETVLYSFGTTASDGMIPSGALIQASDGHLYGTTLQGGTAGMGTVFSLDLVAN